MILPLTVLFVVAPPPVLVAALGSPRCSVREAATHELAVRLARDPDVRWTLYAGLDSPDAEVRWRSAAVLRCKWRWPCYRCARTGRIAALPWEPGWCREDGQRACPECGGAGVDRRIQREIEGECR